MRFPVPMRYILARLLLVSVVTVLLAACSTPPTSSQNAIGVDEDPMGGGISSSDVRTIASRLAPHLLGLPQVAGSDESTRIAMAPMRNNSRFIMDMNIFMKRMRLELNRYSQGKVRFFSQGAGQVTRRKVLEGKNADRLKTTLEELGKDLANLPVVQNADHPPRVAVVPVINANFVNMNADSVIAMLRDRVSSHAHGKLRFLMPGTLDNADYLLTGQFVAESLRTESMVDLSEYIQIVEDRLKEGKSLSVYDEVSGDGTNRNTGNQIIVNADEERRASLLERIATNSRLHAPPNVTKRLNVMLVEADTKEVAYEKMFTIEQKVTEGLGRAELILSGDISGLSKRTREGATDYLLITMQLSDPETNELIWEDGYEVKRQSSSGIVYQ